MASFVGRVAELALLRGALRDARDDRGSTWLLAGEAGIGKSRLVEEIARESSASGFATLWGHCCDADGAPAFWPWIQIVREGLRIAEAAMLDGGRAAHLGQLVPEVGADAARALPPGDRARFMWLDSVANGLVAASRAQPLLVVLEDLHVAAPSSLLMLDFVAQKVRGAPLLILATYRDTEVHDAEAATILQRIAQAHHTIALPPLGQDTPSTRSRALLAYVLGQHDTAIASMTDAVAIARDLGDRTLVAWTSVELAGWLAIRDRTGDRAAAQTLLHEAAVIAKELGIASVTERVATARNRAVSTSVPAPIDRSKPAAEPLELTRSGDVWTLARGSTRFQLRDSKGLRYLARLVAEPRRELHVLDLADALDVVDAGALLAGRARINVQRRIRTAITQIGSHDEGIARHLERSVKTGVFCSYEPE